MAAVIWSGRAVDYFDVTHSRHSELRDAARALGIAPELHLTPEAQCGSEPEEERASRLRRVDPLKLSDARSTVAT